MEKACSPKSLAEVGSVDTASYRESLVNSEMEKGQFKEFNNLEHSESKEVRVGEKIGY